jgi:hypothetical protein
MVFVTKKVAYRGEKLLAAIARVHFALQRTADRRLSRFPEDASAFSKTCRPAGVARPPVTPPNLPDVNEPIHASAGTQLPSPTGSGLMSTGRALSGASAANSSPPDWRRMGRTTSDSSLTSTRWRLCSALHPIEGPEHHRPGSVSLEEPCEETSSFQSVHFIGGRSVTVVA